jgi:hypothetical protein
LRSRLARLEENSITDQLSDYEREAAIKRYADTYHAAAGAFPTAIDPDHYRYAIETNCNPGHQRLLACMLPGDDDI